MRILYALHQLSPGALTGTEKITVSLASSMQRAGHQVEIFAHGSAADKCWPRKGLSISHCSYQGLPITTFASRKNPWDLNATLEAQNECYDYFFDFLNKNSFDLIHLTHLLKTASIAEAAIRTSTPYILTLTDYFSICHHANLITSDNAACFGPNKGNACVRTCAASGLDFVYFSSRLHRAKHILSRAKSIAVPSQFLSDCIRREFPTLKINIVPHGTAFRKSGKPERLYLKSSAVTFGYAGLIQRHKGLHCLIRAFKKIQNPRCRLIIRGDTATDAFYSSFLKKLAANDKRISFCGPYSTEKELVDFLKNIDVLCVPSECYETYALIIEEAFSMRIPVIASSGGALPDRVSHGKTGYIFKAGNENQLSQRMRSLVKNPRIFNSFKANIVSHVLLEEEALQYENLYQKASAKG